MNSPPPSDGILPSSPTQKNTDHAGSSRREKRKAVLTPRKFNRFFTPRRQITSTQPNFRPPALEPLSEASLNIRPSSPQAGLIDPEKSLVSPTSSPISCSKKRKRAPEAVAEAGPSNTVSSEPTNLVSSKRRPVTSSSSSDSTSDVDEAEYAESNYPATGGATQGFDLAAQSTHDALPSSGYQTAPGAPESRSSARVPPSRSSRQARGGESGTVLLKFFRTSRFRPDENKPWKPRPSQRPFKRVNIAVTVPDYTPKSFVKLENRGTSASLLMREMGLTSRPGRHHPQTVELDPCFATSKFFSRSTDWDTCTVSYPQGGNMPAERMVIPFSLASSRDHQFTAVGDEEGYIRMFDTRSTPADQSGRQKTGVYFKVHDNAIMDLDFAADDSRLATACGDRNGKIIDPATTMCIAELNNGHHHALRRVRFQPGQANGNVLSTCDKAGRIQIWDLRISSAPVDAFGTVDDAVRIRYNSDSVHAGIYNTIDPAHYRTVRGRSNGASVTALQWLTGREHIVLSASEVDARIKIWDTRYIDRRNTTTAVPLSSTEAPVNHAWRDYGITSMALNSDASRLYAVCKDSTVYAYSTAHLMLGIAPELSTKPSRQRVAQSGTGLGPLYGFRHENLDVRSFYVRCAVRTYDQGHGPELLAVGSSDSCAVLFPTDEVTLRAAWDRESRLTHAPGSRGFPRPSPPRNNDPSRERIICPLQSLDERDDTTATVAIAHNGTALRGAHQREVTGVSWTCDGKLVTISDDMTVRHWQEAPTQGHTSTHDIPRDARDLRTERNPMKAHLSGWAHTLSSWDDDDNMD